MADLLISTNRFDEAQQQLEDALALVENDTAESSWDDALKAFWTRIVLNDFGKLSVCRNQPLEAVDYLQRSVDIGQQLSSSLAHSPFQANVLGWSYHYLAEALFRPAGFRKPSRRRNNR